MTEFIELAFGYVQRLVGYFTWDNVKFLTIGIGVVWILLALNRKFGLPWCITLDNSKGISRLRFWCKNSRVNGINDLPVFMHQGSLRSPRGGRT